MATFEIRIRELSSVYGLHLEEFRYHFIKKVKVHTKIWYPIKTFIAGSVNIKCIRNLLLLSIQLSYSPLYYFFSTYCKFGWLWPYFT